LEAPLLAGGQELPLSGATTIFSNVGIEGRESAPMLSGATVSEDFFRTMGIPLLRGRAFTTRDREGAPSAAVINDAFVRRFLAPGGGLGQRVENPLRKDDWLTVVGVVGDVRPSPESEPDPTIYFSALQPGAQEPARSGEIPLNLVVRTSAAPMSLAPAVRSLAASIDASLPVYNLSTLEDVRSQLVAPQRVTAILVAVFAELALLLGGIRVYGVLAAVMGERTHELGIRIALGARPGEVVGLVLRQGAGLLVCGIVLGAAGSLSLARWISAELWGVRPTDPVTFAAVIVVISAAGLLACAIPARRATRVDPVVALRCE
jgi:putative ABC transport system permease protein